MSKAIDEVLTREQQIEVYDRIYRLISHYRSCEAAARALGINSHSVRKWLCCSVLPQAAGLICLRNNFLTSVDYILLLSDDPTCSPDMPGAEMQQIRNQKNLPESYMRVVSERLHILVDRVGGVQPFSRTIGFGDRAIWHWLHCESCPETSSILRVCKALSISADWLLGLTDEGGPEWVHQS